MKPKAGADIINGKAYAATLRARIAAQVEYVKQAHGLTPGLAVVLVGADPASEVYVRSKSRQTKEAGMNSFDYKLPATARQEEVLRLIEELNQNRQVHGILMQLPLPAHIQENAILHAIDPTKDVDGFHVINAGKLATGQKGLAPCTPMGCLMLLKDRLHNLEGLHAVVVGRSHIVGKPMAALLLQEHCTVTICHSRTRDLPDIIRQGDIVVAAVGRPEMIRGNWIKPGAVVIDVGINRIVQPDGSSKLIGDVAFEEAKKVAGAITPVPGGVGPMTIACLLANTLQAACSQQGINIQPH